MVESRPAYTAVGSRETPAAVGKLMREIASGLERRGYVLRSGAALGADSAFEDGVTTHKEIFVPWDGFLAATYRRVAGKAYVSPEERGKRYREEPGIFVLEDLPLRKEAEELAAWVATLDGRDFSTYRSGTRALHVRDVYQVLGRDLRSPAQFLICYAPVEGGSIKGGTKVAYEVARRYGVPTYNLLVEQDQAASRALPGVGSQPGSLERRPALCCPRRGVRFPRAASRRYSNSLSVQVPRLRG